MSIEHEAMMIRYRAAIAQARILETVDERLSLLGQVIYPDPLVLEASIQKAKTRLESHLIFGTRDRG